MSIFCINLGFSQIPAGPLKITWPIDRSSFQRVGTSANITIAGQNLTTRWFTYTTLQYQIRKLTLNGVDNGVYIDWTDFVGSEINNVWSASADEKLRTFHKNLTGIETGWYELIVRMKVIFPAFPNLPKYLAKTSIRFGVGDIYIIAGQSNASGFNSADGDDGLISKYNAGEIPDAVNVIDRSATSFDEVANGNGGQKMRVLPHFRGFRHLDVNTPNIYPLGFSSWCWAPLAAKIYESPTQQVPLLFFNAARAGSSIRQWKKTDVADNYQYRPFRNTIQMYGHILGCKGVLWHQGEAEVATSEEILSGWSADEVPPFDHTFNYYDADLRTVISKSRVDFDSQLAWNISRNSAGNYRKSDFPAQPYCDLFKSTPEHLALKTEQNNVIADAGGNRLGADTDNITTRNSCQKVHFHNSGLNEEAQSWFDSQPWNGNAVGGKYIVPIEITKETNGYKLKIPDIYTTGTANEFNKQFKTFRWVRSVDNNEGGLYDGQLADDNNSGFVSGDVTSNNIIISPQTETAEYYTCYLSPDEDATENDGLNIKWYVSQPFITRNEADLTSVIYLSRYQVNVPQTANTNIFNVLSGNVEWSASTNASWITIGPNDNLEGGQGITPIIVNVSANPNPTMREDSVVVNGNDGSVLIYKITQELPLPCGNLLSLSSPRDDYNVTPAYFTKKAVQSISAENKITGSSTVLIYQAGQSILLQPGFRADQSSVFTAKIVANPCDD